MKNTINGMNRETWLNLMIDKAVPIFDKAGFNISDIREKLKVSCSFIQGSRGSKLKNAIGVHYNPCVSDKGFHEMMIHPSVSDSIKAVEVLIHEMTHSIQTHLHHDAEGHLNVKPHGKEFKDIALSVGLVGTKIKGIKNSMTATDGSKELIIQIKKWIKEIGCEYPHAEITINNQKKQSTRNLKVECEDCEWSFRTSNKNILLMTSKKCLCCGNDSLIIV
jgi:hypothetical protein